MSGYFPYLYQEATYNSFLPPSIPDKEAKDSIN